MHTTMGKKLLFLVLLTVAYLLPTSGQAQECPSSVSISSDAGTTICEGTNVTFTATPNGGSSLTYEWFIENVSSGTGTSFSTTTLSNNDKVKVVAKSTDNTACATTSNILTMTVNTVRVPSVSISASTTTICPGENIQFTASPINGGTSPGYVWKVGTVVQSETSNIFSSSSLTDGQSVSVQLTSNATCASPTTAISNSISVTVEPGTPTKPNIISGTAVLCPGVVQTYTIAAVPNATSYAWTLPNGWSGTSATNSINVTSGTTGTGTITVKAINNCGTSEGRDLAVTVKNATPATPGTITGETQVCPGVSQTYSIASVTGASSYEWVLPSGWAGTSSTNSISVTTGATGNGIISVKAKNDCGTSVAKTINITVKAGTPAVPSTISGTTLVCPGIAQTYSIAAVPNATSYLWTLPNGWSGTSTSNSINATTGTVGGNITVKAVNDCGTSAAQTIAITMKPGTPATPSAISGSNNVCPNTSEVYTVTNNSNVSEYIWTLPNGWTGTSTTSTITVNTGTSGSGNITVKAKNDCGTSAIAASIAVSIKAPAPVMSGAISGPARVCSTATGLVYSIPAITNATEYLWTLPNGWTGTSTTNSITVSSSSTEGNISVIAKNTCGSSTSASFPVKVNNTVPAQPGAITSSLSNTSAAICPPASGITFEVPEISGMSYTWTVPDGFVITSGQGTNKLVVNITATTSYSSNAKVDVVATNSCGPSLARSFSNISIDKFVVTNLGEDRTVCSSTSTLNLSGNISFGTGNNKLRIASLTTTGTNQVQGLPNANSSVNDFTYQYTPSSQDLTAGKVTFTLTTEKPAGACAAGTDQMTVFFKPDPTASISGTSTICTGNATDITFSGTPNTIVTYKINSGADQNIAIGTSGTATLPTGALTANTTYSLVSVKNATAPDCPKTITGSAVITITAKPTATISYASSPYNKCISTGQTVTFTGTGAYTNGTFSAPAGLTINATTGAITPSSSTAGTYTVTYETLASGGCEKFSTTSQVIIEAIPTITLNYTGTPFCSNNNTSPLPTLGGTGKYQGGSYSAETGLVINSTSGAINIAASTPGSYNVTYKVIPATGCTPVTKLTPVVITEKPQPTITYSATQFCRSLTNEQPVSLTQSGTAVITGGTYSSLPSGLSINATSGAINPSLSQAGDYTIKYTLAATNGCEAGFTETTVSITEIPSVEISYTGPFCQSTSGSESVTFTNPVGAYQNGIFSTTGGLTINASTGEITPNQSGTHTVTYKIPASGGCDVVTVETVVIITTVPAATITYIEPFCSSETSPQEVSYSNTAGAYQNGEFSGTNGLSIAADGSINPSTSTKGIHTVTYKIPSKNGCEDVISSTDIEIFEQVSITNQPSNVGICSTQAASFEVIASGDGLTYEWKRADGEPITNATGENTSKLSFSNATSTNAGEYYVEVSGNVACSSIATSETVTLNVDEDIVIIKPAEDITICENEVTEITFEYQAHANGAELTFEWIKDNVAISEGAKYTITRTGPTGTTGEYTGTLTINNLVVSDNGDYAVKIKGPNSFTCSEAISKTFTLSINDQPDAPVTAALTYCQGDVADALTATGTNLKWYSTETGDDIITGTPTPFTDAVGFTSYWVSQTPILCESPRAELIVEVKAKPSAPSTTETLSFCLNEVATQLEAVGDNGNTINWYDAAESTTPLTVAPTPITTADITTNYWVSQTKDGCESDRVQITITVNPLPILTAEATEATICSGSSTTLNATGATTYLWTINGTAIEPAAESTKASPTVSPTTTTTYLVTGTSDKGCTSTAEVTITVDEPTVAGTLTGPASVCISSPNGDLSISDYTGDVVRWERSTDGVNWTSIQQTTASLNFTGLSETTTFRSFIKNGVCNEIATNEVTVTIDPLPMGGELSFAGAGRVFTICENPIGNYAVDLNLTGIQGNIAGWYYRDWDATGYTALNIDGEIYTGTSLSAAQIQVMNLNKTTVFQVEVSSGVCSPNSLSKTAIISVIPSDITPTPVTVEPGVVCLGEEVTLNSETGYENGGTFLDQGAFDNASITSHGWRIRRKLSSGQISEDLGFDTDANNTVFDRWKRATPRNFTTASINPNYTTGGVLFDTGIEDGNKGFALVSGNNSSTMETPVFTIGSMDQALLTFDQAYVLTPGASLKVEISTDGGNTYTTLYIREVPTTATIGIASGNTTSFGTGTIDSHPENKIEIDLGDYIGRPNLRIRFNYTGARSGDIWAVDNIDIPEGPNGITMEWRDYTDPAFPDGILIGTNNSEKYTPTEIGLNIFEVKTKLVYNSNGDACEVAENSQRIEVFAFDSYTSTATATGGVCGDSNIVLNGEISSVNQGVITSFPTLDGYETGAWEVVGPSGYTFSDAHFTSVNGISPATKDPNAIFNPGVSGNYSLTWTMVPTAKDTAGNLYTNPGCPPVYIPVTFEIEDCTTLDFDGVDDYVDLGTSYGGNKSIEVWIRPESNTGTVFSTPNFEIKMSDLPETVNPNGRWYHVAVSNGILYVDGIEIGAAGTGKGGSKTLIGARWNDTNGGPENHFSGWIEELRIWNEPITQEQIQFMMNQHLQNTPNMGVEIPMPVPGGLVYSDLAGYYRLISKDPDPTNIVTFDATLLPANGITPDLAINTVPGKLNNMTTNQENTAPLPYLSKQDGVWTDNNTWLRPIVWDIPNSLNESEPIIWNIVRTFNDISSGSKDITVLGLKSETLNKILRIADPNGAQNETNLGQSLTITHYLKLDGNIDLVGESQLLQDQGSILEETSKGWLKRDQQGKKMSFNYNYWTSPVSAQGAVNNAPFLIKNIMNYGWLDALAGTINPLVFTADSNPYGADNPTMNTCPYWLWRFHGTADDYNSWVFIGTTGSLKAGEGYTMKGTTYNGIADYSHSQNYGFKGKPHNGNISLDITNNENYLIGNPYPSAINANEFIYDNLNSATVTGARNNKNLFNGVIYFWDHFSGATHVLKEYIGGYATLTLIGGLQAISSDARINANEKEGNKTPSQFIPVGQGFFVNSGIDEQFSSGYPFTISPGNLEFKNSQRVFSRESSGNSTFLKPENVVKTGKEESQSTTSRIRISFKSPKGYNRQLLVGTNPNTTNGFDLGYDAPLIEYNVEDMYWIQGNNWLVIQGVPDFGKEQVLPLGIRIEKAGEFTIKIDTLENMNPDHTIYLKDKLLDSIHDIKSGPYKSTSVVGEITDRFQVIFYKESKSDPDPIGGDPVVDVPVTDPIIIDELTEISLLHSYTENEMMVLNPNELEISAIYLFDMNGKLLEVFDEIPSEKEIRLKVNNFSDGIYVLKMHTDTEIITRKIVIKK